MENKNRGSDTHLSPHRIDEVLTDSHVHLHFPHYGEDRDDVIRRAEYTGVKWMVEVGCGEGLKSIEDARKIAHSHRGIYYAAGVHPHETAMADDEWFERIKTLRSDPLFVALGETGLDYAKKYSPVAVQKKWFTKSLRLSAELQKPLVVHVRDAMDDALAIVEKEGNGLTGGIFHCFSGDVEQARKALSLGFYLSISGTVTFKKSRVREVVQTLPVEAFLVETDSPFLSPHPYRGKRNEPARVKEVVEEIARLKNLAPEDVMRVTNLNFHRAFKIPYENEPKIAYRIRNSLYLNITNRCTNTCTFCGKFRSWYVKGHYLKLDKEPSTNEILDAVGDNVSRYDEVVFCGYGEPLLRLDVVKDVASVLKKRGAASIRIDTDGLASAVHGIDVPAYLKGLIDMYSVSLNAPDAATYNKLCRPPSGMDAFNALLNFVRSATKYARVVVTAVEIPGAFRVKDVQTVADTLNVPLRMRPFNDLG